MHTQKQSEHTKELLRKARETQMEGIIYSCKICGKDFNPNSPRQYFCSKECKSEGRRIYARNKYKKQPEEKRLEQQRKRGLLRDKHRLEIKSFLLEYKGRTPCVICGELDHRCLQFHHKDAYLKKKNVSELIRNGASLTRLKEELELCDVVCANCHLKIHYKMRGINKNDTTKEDYNPTY